MRFEKKTKSGPWVEQGVEEPIELTDSEMLIFLATNKLPVDTSPGYWEGVPDA